MSVDDDMAPVGFDHSELKGIIDTYKGTKGISESADEWQIEER
jgi:hypothetical protein